MDTIANHWAGVKQYQLLVENIYIKFYQFQYHQSQLKPKSHKNSSEIILIVTFKSKKYNINFWNILTKIFWN